MRITKYILGLGFFTGIFFPTQAQTNQAQKLYYNMDRLKLDNPWSISQNASGLLFRQAEDYSNTELGYKYDEGKFRNVSAPTSQGGFHLSTESFRHLKKTYFYGKFNLEYTHRQNKTWSSSLYPDHSIYVMADSVPGRQTLELYHLSGGIAHPIGKHFAIGGSLDFAVASNAKKRDPRNNNTYMDFQIYPGVMYRSKHFNAGLNFMYQKITEDVNIKLFGSDKTHTIYNFESLWFYTTTMLSFEGSNTNRSYKEDIVGGAAQIEWHWNNLRFLNQFSGSHSKQETFGLDQLNDRTGEMEIVDYQYKGALNLDGSMCHHYLRLAYGYNDRMGFDNIQNKETVNGTSMYVQYGKKNKSEREIMQGEISYALYKDRSPYNSAWNALVGVKGSKTNSYYRLFPVRYEQEIKDIEGYMAFNKNFLFEKGMLDCGLNMAYAKGSGTMLEHDEKLPDVDKYLQCKDQLFEEYEYLTSDRFNGGLDIRYTRFLNTTKGMALYADLKGSWSRSLSGYFDGKNRAGFMATVGLSF